MLYESKFAHTWHAGEFFKESNHKYLAIKYPKQPSFFNSNQKEKCVQCFFL